MPRTEAYGTSESLTREKCSNRKLGKIPELEGVAPLRSHYTDWSGFSFLAHYINAQYV